MKNIEVRRQLFATASANLVSFSFGWLNAWTTANFLELQSPSTLLPDGPITYDEAAIMMSLICIGGLVGNSGYLWIIETFGRKKPILFLAVPMTISWVLIIFAKNAYWLFASRFCCGLFSGALFVSIPIFVSEISSDSIRGQLNALCFVITTLGALAGFIVALFLDYRMQAICGLIVPIVFVFVFYFVPETPVYLQKVGKKQLAELSLEFYQGTKELPETAKFVDEKKSEIEGSDALTLYDFFGTRASRRAMLISFGLVYLPQCTGSYILLNYTTPFFAEAGSSMTPLQSSILICIVQLVANGITTVFIERWGRKVIFVVSCVGSGLGMIVLALHRLYKDDLPSTYDFVPMYGLSFVIFIASIGLLPCAYIITIDILPPKIRNITMTLTSLNIWVLGFGTNIAYLYLLPVIKLYGCLLIFSSFCFMSALFALLFIPETKGKSYEIVRQILEK